MYITADAALMISGVMMTVAFSLLYIWSTRCVLYVYCCVLGTIYVKCIAFLDLLL